MKKILLTLCSIIFLLATTASADIVTIGTASYNGTNHNLIWDSDNNGNSILWMDYTNATADWSTQNTWAASLSSLVTINLFAGYSIDWIDDNWRLPSAGTTPIPGFNITTSEIGHLYTIELGIQIYTDIGQFINPPINTSSDLNAKEFDNLVWTSYWTETEYAALNTAAWYYNFTKGSQTVPIKTTTLSAIAVINADVSVSSVPVPTTIILLASGLLGVVGVSRRKK